MERDAGGLRAALGLAVGDCREAGDRRDHGQRFLAWLPDLTGRWLAADRSRLNGTCRLRRNDGALGDASGYWVAGPVALARGNRDWRLGVLSLEVHHALVRAEIADRGIRHCQVVLRLRVLFAEVAVDASG